MHRLLVSFAFLFSYLVHSQESITFAAWLELDEEERRTIASNWSPYDTSDKDSLLEQIVADFRTSYPQLDVRGMGNVFGNLMIVVMRPFIFDRRQAPERHLGLPIRYTPTESVPAGFEVNKSYVWAPENYLKFVDNHAAEIRARLGSPDMAREEMLEALIGMPFDDWIVQCIEFGEGYTAMKPGERELPSKPWWKFW